MKLANVIGSVTATTKDAQLVGHKLLVCDVVDSKGTVIEPGLVAVDSVGAGAGDQVLLVTGSAARMAAATSTLPIDAAIVAIIDSVDIR